VTSELAGCSPRVVNAGYLERYLTGTEETSSSGLLLDILRGGAGTGMGNGRHLDVEGARGEDGSAASSASFWIF